MSAPSIESESELEPQLNPALLLRACVFPHPVSDLRIRETNLSWIILTGEYAYKIKKNRAFSFVDQSTLKRRKALCHEELRLNRRLASELYEQVVPITRDEQGLKVGGAGVVVEYAVKMKQFPAAHELAALLEHKNVAADEIRSLGIHLADFHRSLPEEQATAPLQGTQQLHDAVLGTLATVLCHLDESFTDSKLGSLVDWVHDFLRDSLFLLCKREQEGHIRECHGDLHARNIVRWQGQLIPFDSLDFDPKLRWVDTMNDVAFLFMDLMSYHRSDLAFDFLNAYLSRSGDYGGARLLRFYAVYRALVRAMVDVLAVDAQPIAVETYRQRAHLRIDTAARLVDASPPVLILMHGLAGSGKSWMSAQLAEHLGAVQVRSDVERKRLQAQSGATEIHTAEFNRSTYARLLACAEGCLQGGFTVILDAAFLEADEREQFKSWANAHDIPFLVVSCQAEVTELEARIGRRSLQRTDASDADPAELHRQLRTWVPMAAQEKARVIEVDTMSNAALPKTLERIRAMLSRHS